MNVEDETPEIVLSIVVIIILIVFFGYILYLLFSSNFQSTSPNNPVTSDNRVDNTIICPAGECATSLFSGFKRCPTNGNEQITVNPSQEVCNPVGSCTSPFTPFSINSDGSYNFSGVCESINTPCRCVNTPQCADYILSVFTTSNGNPYESLQGQRLTFPQQTFYVGSRGTQIDTPPIKITSPSTTFCAASLAFLPLSNPGCNLVKGTNSMTYNDLVLCMGGSSGCNGININPCLQGTLAALSSNPDSVSQANIYLSQFACVRGEPCPCGQIAIYDTNYNGIVCRTLT